MATVDQELQVPAEGPRDPNVGTFVFGEVEVEARKLGGKWHLHAAGHEVTADHLGTATRILFNPTSNPSTRPLIAEILTWHRQARAAAVPDPAAGGMSGNGDT